MADNLYLIVQTVLVDSLLKRVRLSHESHHDCFFEIFSCQTFRVDWNTVQENLWGVLES